MLNKFLADINVIKNAINTKKLVVFAGAGISIDAGVPSWSKLIDEIKKELDLPDYENDYLKIPQIYYNERQEKEYIEKIRDVLQHKKIRYNEIHEEIFELNPEHILTTNFEDLLEQVINKKSLPFSVVKKDEDLPYSNNTKLLVKVHGDLNDTDFVLKEDDYLNYSKNHPLIEAFINSTFASKVVLFIGYSFSDYNLKQIVQNVRNILGNNFQNAYLLSIDRNIHLSHKEYLKNKGIKIINYFDSVYNNNGTNKNFIEEFLEGHNVFNEKYLQKIDTLSDKGQNLLNLIKFIRFYDDFKIKLTEENALNQVYNSLNRFSEIKFLPQDFLVKMYPFKTSIGNERLINKTTLLIKTSVLKNLFFNHIHIKEGSVVYIKSENSKEDNRKAKEIIKRLNNSIVFHLTTKEISSKKSKSDLNKDISISSDKKCNCSSCKFKRFQFKETINDILNYSINEISDIREDIQKAYLNYKFGNFYNSYRMFEEIAAKCWQSGKYTSYYVSKVNMKLLINFFDFSNNERKKTNNENKTRDIDDLDRLIFEIPYRSDEEYELLKMIRDDSVLKEAERNVYKYYGEIEELFEKYKSLHYSQTGKYYPQIIYIELYKLKTFYTENYIIGDVFLKFKKIVQKSVEALILLNQISKSYSGKLKELSAEFFVSVVSYCNTSDLDAFFKRKKLYISDLNYKEEDLDDILSFCINFFDSTYTTNRYSHNKEKNNLLYNSVNEHYFEDEIRIMFRNILFLIAGVNLSGKYKVGFIESLIDFLEVETFLFGKDIEILNFFLQKKQKLFNEKNCKKLLDIISNKNKIRKYSQYDTIHFISQIIETNNFDLISDDKYIIKMLNDLEFEDKYRNHIVGLWKISSKEIKQLLKSRLIERLKNSFDLDLYKDACYSGVINVDLFFKEYVKKSSESVIISANQEEIYFYRDDKPKFNSFFFYHFIRFIYFKKIEKSDERLKLFTKSTPLIDFYLYRREEDLSSFKVEWLLLFNYKIFHEEISKIKGFKKIITKKIKESDYDDKISEIYVKYFI